jgi:hypothetical protein
LVSGCGTTQSHFIYDSSFQINAPQTDQGCYDAAVVLDVSLPRAKEIVKQVLAANGMILFTKVETDTHLRAMTPLKTFPAGGGEDLNVRFEKVGENQTFITVTTMTMPGNKGKPWSCEVIEEFVLRAEE